MRSGLLLIMILLLGEFIFSQEFGANPFLVKWRQLNSSEARIVFPDGLDSSAQRIADVLRYLNRHTGETAGSSRQRKISIVLQNQTTLSNGYVGLAPWRSEFFLTPSFNSFQLGSLPWTESLALHEYRHVQQYMNYRKGLSRLAYIILGEEGQAMANNAAIPNWFFEGDAVFQETAFSGQGRGRLPFFFNGYRSLWEADRKYSYMKLRNGSLKHFIPDQYAMGYLLTAYGREKYGDRFWTAVTDDAVRFKNLFYPFQKAVKRHSGISYKTFVDDAFGYYKSQAEPASIGSFITKWQNKFVTNYSMPCFAGNDSLIVLKKTYRNLPAWWLLTEKGEEKIKDRDITREDDFTYRNGKIVYTAYEPDAIWGGRDYSVIKILDVASKREVQLTHRSKYFQPDISMDGKEVVALQFTPDQHQELHVLDASTGTILRRVPSSTDQSYIYTYPRYYDKEHIVSCVRNAEGLMSLAMINLSTGAMESLIPWSFEVKGFPLAEGDTIYFSAGNGYRDDIFALDVKTRNLYKLTDEALGAYQPAVNKKGRLVWSTFTASGMQLKERNIQMKDWQPYLATASINTPDLYLPNALQQTGGNILSHIPTDHYPVTKYHKSSGLFNFHSWRPYYEQPEWSFSVYGQNILNTFQSELYYSYNENEDSHTTGFSGLYGGWFPWLTGGVAYSLNRKQSDTVRTVRWNELNANMGLRAPLDFTAGRWYKLLVLASSFHVSQLNVTGKYKDSITGKLVNYMQLSVNWNSQTQKAVQHINPHFAQSFLLRYRSVLNGHTAQQLLGTATLALPGVGVNHSLVFSGAYQMRDTAKYYYFSNGFPFARGYIGYDAPRMWKGNINYHFPLFYPDWGVGQLVYFMRVRANLFFDYAQVKSLYTGERSSFRSAGTELFFDTRWWNQQPVTFGIRYSHLFDKHNAGVINPNVWEFILPVDLLSR